MQACTVKRLITNTTRTPVKTQAKTIKIDILVVSRAEFFN